MSRCVEVERIEGHVKTRQPLAGEKVHLGEAMGIKDGRRVEAECRGL